MKDYITLTDIDIDRCMTPRGGFLAESVRLLGEDVTVKGWRVRLRGRRIPRSDYNRAVEITRVPRLRGVQHGEAQDQSYLKLF